MKPYLINDMGHWIFSYPEEMEEVFDEFWEAFDFLDHDEDECQKRFKKIIEKYPEAYIDAYNYMSISFRNQGKTHESLHYAITAYLLGKSCIQPEFKQGEDQILWGHIENRPFLRSCQILGLEYEYRKDYRRAIELYLENLSYNEGDNQGIRYLLLECYFATKDYKALRDLLDQNPNDWGVDFLYGKILLEILTGNDSSPYVEAAFNRNGYIVDEVLKQMHVNPGPYKDPDTGRTIDGAPAGSIQEAYEYWQRNKQILNLKKVKAEFKKIKKDLQDESF
ncbi:MAG: tetratricopeptide repeat protein [Bacteroidetes bacterium]|nr:tetratricopeptide repeat protein [Bacteroidota bacterium]